MGVGVTIHNTNLAKPGSWRPKWHPVKMTEHVGIGRSAKQSAASVRSFRRRSARRRRRARRRRKRAGK